jgi:hypothetical protein
MPVSAVSISAQTVLVIQQYLTAVSWVSSQESVQALSYRVQLPVHDASLSSASCSQLPLEATHIVCERAGETGGVMRPAQAAAVATMLNQETIDIAGPLGVMPLSKNAIAHPRAHQVLRRPGA